MVKSLDTACWDHDYPNFCAQKDRRIQYQILVLKKERKIVGIQRKKDRCIRRVYPINKFFFILPINKLGMQM